MRARVAASRSTAEGALADGVADALLFARLGLVALLDRSLGLGGSGDEDPDLGIELAFAAAERCQLVIDAGQ